MESWISESLKDDRLEASASRALDAVIERGARRKKRIHLVKASIAPTLLLVLFLAAIPSLLPRKNGRSTKTPDQQISLARVDHSVALKWKAKPGEKYEVYRCTSPKFDRCSLAAVVSGDRWVDVDDGGAKVVYYKVVGCEPKKGGAVGSASSRFS